MRISDIKSLAISVIIVPFILYTFTTIAFANKRVALVIGNQSYIGSAQLQNPVGDANILARKLETFGFQTTVEHNQTKIMTEDSIKSFIKKSIGAEVALVFFSGHGLQINNKNYLVPVDAKLENSDAAQFELLDLEQITSTLSGKAEVTLFLLDASRSNISIQATNQSFSDSRGLTVVQNRNLGTLVSFSSEPGNHSIESDGPHSHYVQALIDHLGTPDESISETMTKVRRSIFEATNGIQVSRDYNSLLEEFVLNPGKIVDTKETQVESGLEAELELLKKELAKLENSEAHGKQQTQQDAETGYKIGSSFKDCDDCPELAVIPNGSFRIGSPKGEDLRDNDEGPRKTINFEKPFAIGRFEVTHGEFKEFMKDTGRKPRHNCWNQPGFIQTDNQPIICVSWSEAQEYISWLSKKTGLKFRLPSESEWEYSARAGTSTMFGFGSQITPQTANYETWFEKKFSGAKRQSSVVFISPAPVNVLQANNFGLFHMHGNATEFVADCYTDSYENIPLNGSAYQENDCKRAISRGGGWRDKPWSLRSASRRVRGLWEASRQTGFRVARDLLPEEISTVRVVPDVKGVDLAKAMQEQLNRLGCLSGGVDGIWGRGSKRALQLFSDKSGQNIQNVEPQRSTLAVLIGTERRVCAQ